MSEVRIIDPVKTVGWDTFVEKHPYGWLYHHSDWKRVLDESFNHLEANYLTLANGDGIQAALPLFSVKTWSSRRRLVSMPYSTLCDPLVSSPEEMKELFEFALNLSEKLKSSGIEIRSFQASAKLPSEHFTVVKFYKYHYLTLDAPPKELLKRFHRSCIRQKIARAEKSRLNLRMADSEADIMKFYRIYVQTRKRHGLPPIPYRFLKKTWEILSENKRASIYLAFYGRQCIAGLLVLKYKNRASAELAASDAKFLNLCANHLLFWQSMKDVQSEGYEIYDFGRTSPPNVGLMDFKRRWGSSVMDLPVFFYPKEAGPSISEKKARMKGFAGSVIKRTPDAILPYVGYILYRRRW